MSGTRPVLREDLLSTGTWCLSAFEARAFGSSRQLEAMVPGPSMVLFLFYFSFL